MRLPSPSKTTLLFLLPMLALPLGMLALTVLAVTRPITAFSEPKQVSTEPVNVLPEARTYQAFISPLTVSLPENSGTLNIELGVAIPQHDDQTVKKILQENPDRILGNLATTLLDAFEAEGVGSDSIKLRALIPGVLKSEMNKNLLAMGASPEILEVFIIDWALLP